MVKEFLIKLIILQSSFLIQAYQKLPVSISTFAFRHYNQPITIQRCKISIPINQLQCTIIKYQLQFTNYNAQLRNTIKMQLLHLSTAPHHSLRVLTTMVTQTPPAAAVLKFTQIPIHPNLLSLLHLHLPPQ